jgi:hypothetical protein
VGRFVGCDGDLLSDTCALLEDYIASKPPGCVAVPACQLSLRWSMDNDALFSDCLLSGAAWVHVHAALPCDGLVLVAESDKAVQVRSR